MQALFPPLEEKDMESAVEKQIYANFAALKSNKKRKVEEKEQIAQEAAELVQQEIQRWQNSIRELEERLAESGEEPAVPPQHPNSPAIILDEPDDDYVTEPSTDSDDGDVVLTESKTKKSKVRSVETLGAN